MMNFQLTSQQSLHLQSGIQHFKMCASQQGVHHMGHPAHVHSCWDQVGPRPCTESLEAWTNTGGMDQHLSLPDEEPGGLQGHMGSHVILPFHSSVLMLLVYTFRYGPVKGSLLETHPGNAVYM